MPPTAEEPPDLPKRVESDRSIWPPVKSIMPPLLSILVSIPLKNSDASSSKEDCRADERVLEESESGETSRMPLVPETSMTEPFSPTILPEMLTDPPERTLPILLPK